MSQPDQKREVTKLRKARPDLVDEYETTLWEADETRRFLLAGPFPGMGTGDPDLYKAFSWRFWQLVRIDGAIGVVLPRSALSASGSAPWRIEVLDHGAFTDVAMILNNSQWFFEDVHPQYTVALVSIRKGDSLAGDLVLSGPFASMKSYTAGRKELPSTFSSADFKEWSEGASFPLIPSAEAGSVFRKLRAHPRLDATDGWICKPATEFHATNDKRLFDFEPSTTEGLWPVYKGASFNLWEPDTQIYYGWADPDEVLPVLQDKRVRSARRVNSPYSGFPKATIEDPETLPCLSPRIVFRDIARATDTRTTIACLLPPQVVLTNTAPYL